jgi:biopolymer transport protein ExbD
MGRRSAIVSVHQIRDINLIPLIDVMMFLLVVFIITMPLLEQGIPLKLPSGKATDISGVHNRSITLDLAGRVYLDNKFTTRDDLASEMNLMGRADPDLTVLVRADENLAYGRVAEIVKILHDAHITRMGLVYSPEAKLAAPQEKRKR